MVHHGCECLSSYTNFKGAYSGTWRAHSGFAVCLQQLRLILKIARRMTTRYDQLESPACYDPIDTVEGNHMEVGTKINSLISEQCMFKFLGKQTLGRELKGLSGSLQTAYLEWLPVLDQLTMIISPGFLQE